MRRGRAMPLGANIILIMLAVVFTLGVLFVLYCGVSSACTGTAFADTLADTWCTIFGLARNVAETTPEVVKPIIN